MRSTTPYFDQTRRKSGTIRYLSWMRSFVPVHHRPMGAFEWRGNDLHNDVISTSGGGKYPPPGKKAIFPTINLHHFAPKTVNLAPRCGNFHLRFPAQTKTIFL